MPYSPAGTVNCYGTATNCVGIDYGLGNYQTYVMAVPTIQTYAPYYQTPILTNAVITYEYVVWPQQAQAPTPEEIADMEERQKKFNEERMLIDLRAREILEATLDATQREQLKQESFFDLEVSSGRIYRIKPGRKVERLDPKTRKATSLFCIHPVESLPADDIAVSQKMWLETDEETFLKVANETKIGEYDVAA